MFCPNCGVKNSDESRFCSNCGRSLIEEVPSETAEEKLSLALEPPAVSHGPIAALWKRFLAIVLDTILITVVYAAFGMWIASRYGGITASGFSMEGMPALIAILLTSIAAFLYFWLLEGLFGGTIGKKIMGIGITNLSGQPCGLTGSLIRNLLRIVDGLFAYFVGFLIAIFSKKRQRLGDHIANTVVTESKPGQTVHIAMIILWFGIVFSSLVLAWALHKVPQNISSVQKGAPEMAAGAVSGDLRIAYFAFFETRDGQVRANNMYKPGDKLFTRYNITGYSVDSQGMISMLIEVIVLDPDNIIMFQWKGNLAQKPAPNTPVDGWFNCNIVPYAPPGTYRIKVKATDLLKNNIIEHSEAFNVVAPPPVFAKRLEIRDFLISTSEGGQPLNPVIASLGNSIHTKAKLAGVQPKGDNINVRIAFQLINPEGAVVIDKPDFLIINDAYEYHPQGFFLPFTANVTLPSSGPTGYYTQKFMVTDLNANISATHALRFLVK
jgi:uncharacterized RDD family membrane protein YckC